MEQLKFERAEPVTKLSRNHKQIMQLRSRANCPKLRPHECR